MKSAALAFFLVNAIALLSLPRRWALVPLLVGCCYMTIGQGISLGSFSLPLYRMLLAVGFLRVLVRRERLIGGLTSVDKLVLAWGAWIMFASLFHNRAPGSGPEYASGLVFNILGAYFLIRIWSGNVQDVVAVVSLLSLILVPVALEMTSELFTERNLFSVFGGVQEGVSWRDGRFRAQGPFRHPILAGTVGATCFPLFIGLWNYRRSLAVVGIAASGLMVLASGSSGPMMSCILAVGAVGMWRFRSRMHQFRWLAVLVYIVLEIVMSRPAYYIIEKGNLTGSSTGWHRAQLIESSIKHLGEWWLVGTDYTRHWMASGTTFNPDHVDITNYYLMFGVVAGLPALVLLVAILWKSFRRVGIGLASAGSRTSREVFFIWCFGAALFAHAATSLSVAYFDQSMLFFWATVAIIGSVQANPAPAEAEAQAPAEEIQDEESGNPGTAAAS